MLPYPTLPADPPLAKFVRLGYCDACACHHGIRLDNDADERRACPEGHGPLGPPRFRLPKHATSAARGSLPITARGGKLRGGTP